MQQNSKPLLITIPHSGERVPVETPWLKGLDEKLLMCDVDRYVDQLYQPAINQLGIVSVRTEWHRYAVDLNRWKDDVDSGTVLNNANPAGRFSRGLHWAITTKGEKLMPGPIANELHELLVAKYFQPFHTEVKNKLNEFKKAGTRVVYHIDAHSMPSLGTKEHLDPGEQRADVVVSDCGGKSCGAAFRDLVIDAYRNCGFSVSLNWPYKGGRVTETYGNPSDGVESIQVELNRRLYMNEESKRLLEAAQVVVIQKKISLAIATIFDHIPLN